MGSLGGDLVRGGLKFPNLFLQVRQTSSPVNVGLAQAKLTLTGQLNEAAPPAGYYGQ